MLYEIVIRRTFVNVSHLFKEQFNKYWVVRNYDLDMAHGL